MLQKTALKSWCFAFEKVCVQKIRDLVQVLHYFVKKAMELSEEAFQFVAKLYCKYTYTKSSQDIISMRGFQQLWLLRPTGVFKRSNLPGPKVETAPRRFTAKDDVYLDNMLLKQ